MVGVSQNKPNMQLCLMMTLLLSWLIIRYSKCYVHRCWAKTNGVKQCPSSNVPFNIQSCLLHYHYRNCCWFLEKHRSAVMKINAIITILLVAFILTSCAPAAIPSPIQPPAAVETSTSAPVATLTLIPTATTAPTLAPTPIVEVK